MTRVDFAERDRVSAFIVFVVSLFPSPAKMKQLTASRSLINEKPAAAFFRGENLVFVC